MKDFREEVTEFKNTDLAGFLNMAYTPYPSFITFCHLVKDIYTNKKVEYPFLADIVFDNLDELCDLINYRTSSANLDINEIKNEVADLFIEKGEQNIRNFFAKIGEEKLFENLNNYI